MSSNIVHTAKHVTSSDALTNLPTMQQNVIPFHAIESNGVKLSINHMKIIARWQYNLNNHICTLCKGALGKPYETKESGSHVYKTTIDIGACNDGFHEKCMSEWLTASNKNECPECKNVWKKQSSVNAGVMTYTP